MPLRLVVARLIVTVIKLLIVLSKLVITKLTIVTAELPIIKTYINIVTIYCYVGNAIAINSNYYSTRVTLVITALIGLVKSLYYYTISEKF